MELSDTVTLPVLVGMGIATTAAAAAREVRHTRDLQHAQRWVDHLALSSQYAQQDYSDLLAELTATRREAATLRAALEESDQENLRLSIEVGRMRRVAAH